MRETARVAGRRGTIEDMSPKQVKNKYDLIIVGAGAAGLSAALGFLRNFDQKTAGRTADVLIVSKLQALRSHTGSAEGGIAASLGNVEKDDWHWHYYDTVKGGDWLVDQDMAQILTREAPATVIALEHDGVAFSRLPDGRIAQRLFGGHTAQYGKKSLHRTAYAADRIGHQILHSLWQQCVALGVEFAEEWYVTDLVTSSKENTRTACGLIVLDTHTGQLHALHAANIIIATGGAGHLFHTTSNSWDLTGDGMALALNTGLQLEDSEFIQFHPTGLGHTGILLSEAARSEGGVLRNANGERFMTRYAPDHMELAARDVVTRSIFAETQAGRGVTDPMDPDGAKDCVWLDLTEIGEQQLKTAIPEVYSTIVTYAGINPARDLVPVKPTAHYTMGGIPINQDGQVYEWKNSARHTVSGLYAAGECSCGSVHGANRLGSNSLLDACLFGNRAGRNVARRVTQTPARREEGEEMPRALADALAEREKIVREILSVSSSADAGNAYALMADLGTLMEEDFAISCDEASLTHALGEIEARIAPAAARLHAHTADRAFNQELQAVMECRNLVEVARVTLLACLARHESRGSLYRRDYPERDDEHFLVHSLTGKSGVVDWEPVTIIDFQPEKRSY